MFNEELLNRYASMQEATTCQARGGKTTTKLSYETLTRKADEVFGVMNWSQEHSLMEQHYLDRRNNAYDCMYTTKVKITANKKSRSFQGCGLVKGAPDIETAIQVAQNRSIEHGAEKCFRMLGNYFNLPPEPEGSDTTETRAPENRPLSSTNLVTTTDSIDHQSTSKEDQRRVPAATAPTTSVKISKPSSSAQHPSAQNQSSLSSSSLRRRRSNLSYTTEDKENHPPEKRMKETTFDMSDNQSDEYDQDEGLDADLVEACMSIEGSAAT